MIFELNSVSCWKVIRTPSRIDLGAARQLNSQNANVLYAKQFLQAPGEYTFKYPDTAAAFLTDPSDFYDYAWACYKKLDNGGTENCVIFFCFK